MNWKTALAVTLLWSLPLLFVAPLIGATVWGAVAAGVSTPAILLACWAL